MIHALIRCASKMNVVIHVWVSIPCTAGCRWRRINDAKGIVTGDPELTRALIDAAKPVCIHAAKVGGIVSWEWPSTTELWEETPDVEAMLVKLGAVPCLVSTAAVGMYFEVTSAKLKKYLKKKWLIKTTLVELQRRLEPYAQIPEFPVDAFVECRGKFARLSANYTPLLASIIWASTMPHRIPSVVALFQQGGTSMATITRPCLPLWCSMITRSISLKSEEANLPEVKAAMQKELKGHAERGTWDLSTVREHSDLMRDPTQKEAMIGRVFGILGCRNAEMLGSEDPVYKYRVVFQGSNVHTKTGVSAGDI